MLVEQRIYNLLPGKVDAYVDFFERHDLSFMVPIMGMPVGWYTTEFGPLNQVIQMWAFEDMDDRDRRRAAVVRDPAWKGHIANLGPLVVSQESKLLRPAPFFAKQLAKWR